MPESTLSVSRSRYYGDVRNMTDAGKGFTTETVRSNRCQVVKRTQLTGREPLAHDFHIFLLQKISA